jgi:hypothetical protein
MANPWECPRCRTINSPIALFCQCKPNKLETSNSTVSHWPQSKVSTEENVQSSCLKSPYHYKNCQTCSELYNENEVHTCRFNYGNK